MAKKQFRKISVNNEEYKYKVGKSGVKLRKPDGTGQFVGLVDLTGNQFAIEQMENCELEITPGMISKYIRENMSLEE